MLRVVLILMFLLTFFMGAYLPAIVFFMWLLVGYGGFEIVILGLLLDGYYGAYTEVPLYTIGGILFWSGALAIRKLLIIYDSEHASFS